MRFIYDAKDKVPVLNVTLPFALIHEKFKDITYREYYYEIVSRIFNIKLNPDEYLISTNLSDGFYVVKGENIYRYNSIEGYQTNVNSGMRVIVDIEGLLYNMLEDCNTFQIIKYNDQNYMRVYLKDVNVLVNFIQESDTVVIKEEINHSLFMLIQEHYALTKQILKHNDKVSEIFENAIITKIVNNTIRLIKPTLCKLKFNINNVKSGIYGIQEEVLDITGNPVPLLTDFLKNEFKTFEKLHPQIYVKNNVLEVYVKPEYVMYVIAPKTELQNKLNTLDFELRLEPIFLKDDVQIEDIFTIFDEEIHYKLEKNKVANKTVYTTKNVLIPVQSNLKLKQCFLEFYYNDIGKNFSLDYLDAYITLVEGKFPIQSLGMEEFTIEEIASVESFIREYYESTKNLIRKIKSKNGITMLYLQGNGEVIIDHKESYKETEGKLFYELDWSFIDEMAVRMSSNKDKYEKWNWKKPMSEETIENMLQANFRHVKKTLEGNFKDNDQEYGHLAALACNAMILYYQLKNRK